jgi:ribosomal protein S14
MLLIVPRDAQRSVNRGIGGLGIELRKLENRDADVLRINGRQHVRERKREPLTVLRSQRPQTRLETSCTRTGRPRRHLLRNTAAGRWEKAMAVRPACPPRGIGQRNNTYESFEQGRETVRGE